MEVRGYVLTPRKRNRNWPVQLPDGRTHVFDGSKPFYTLHDLSKWVPSLLDNVHVPESVQKQFGSAPNSEAVKKHESFRKTNTPIVPKTPLPSKSSYQIRSNPRSVVIDRSTGHAPIRTAVNPVAAIEYIDPKEHIPISRQPVDVKAFAIAEGVTIPESNEVVTDGESTGATTYPTPTEPIATIGVSEQSTATLSDTLTDDDDAPVVMPEKPISSFRQRKNKV